MKVLLCLFAWLLLPTGRAYPEERPKGESAIEIRPPLGLKWGQAADDLAKLMPAAKATIVARRITPDGRTAWDVEGLVQTGLRRTVFYFREARLDEVEMQYERPEWDEAKYVVFMAAIRKTIESHYGPGLELTPTSSAGTVNAVQWTFPGTEMDLLHHLARGEGHEVPWVSVHYKTK